MQCVVKSCKKKSLENKNLSFFRLPADPLIRELWIVNCDLKKLKPLLETDTAHVRNNYRICANHFEDKMFLRPSLKNRLTFNAVPTLFSGTTLSESQEKQTIKEEFKTQAFCPSCSSPITDRKPLESGSFKNLSQPMYMNHENIELIIKSMDENIKELKKQLDSQNESLNQINTVEQMLKLCRTHMSSTLFLFIKTYIHNKGKKPKDFFYCGKMLDLAKTLYLLSSNVYQYLLSILPLPPLCVLKRALSPNEIHPADRDLIN